MAETETWADGGFAVNEKYFPPHYHGAAALRMQDGAVDGLEEVSALIVRDVAELPDRTSPQDWPEAMLVTPEELRAILSRRLRHKG